ncbi:MAG: hypothetical protein Kow006_05230 [Gammaproteobacteria bacterium]
MKKLMKTRNLFSLTAVSAVLSAALMAGPAAAESNDTYRTIHQGYLSEYQVQPGEMVENRNGHFSAVSAENETFASIHEGWLSEYRLLPGEVSASSGKTFKAISAENETFASIHEGWLSRYENGSDATALASR